MGLFNDKFKSTVVSYSPRNEQEAWLAIMHACIAVDEEIAEPELEELSEDLARLSIFEGHDIREYYRNVLLTHAEIGSKHLIDNSVDAVSPEKKSALFSITMELLLADGILAEKEKELISYLISALDLDEKVANRIVQHKLNERLGNNKL